MLGHAQPRRSRSSHQNDPTTAVVQQAGRSAELLLSYLIHRRIKKGRPRTGHLQAYNHSQPSGSWPSWNGKRMLPNARVPGFDAAVRQNPRLGLCVLCKPLAWADIRTQEV
jgi:hypothetical protein